MPKPLLKQICVSTTVIVIVIFLYMIYSFNDSEWMDTSKSNVVVKLHQEKEQYNKQRGNIKDLVKTPIHDITPRGKNFHWVDNAKGENFTVRISQYNVAINEIRKGVILARGPVSEWKEIINPSPHVLLCRGDNFMFALQKYDQVQTVVLPWLVDDKKSYLWFHLFSKKTDNEMNSKSWSSLTDKHNVLVQDYYEWVGNEPLCRHIKTPNFTKARWDVVYNRSCNTAINKTFTPKSLEILYLYGIPISSHRSYFYDELPDKILYMHIIQDAVVTVTGEIHSGNLKLVPYSCSQRTNPNAPTDYKNSPIFNEVFSMTGYWGKAFFHKMVEQLPRIAAYVEYLLKNKHIKIHVTERKSYTNGLLKLLGFGPERIISSTARAKVLYLPQATPCGFAQAQEIQLVSKLYREKITKFGLGVRNLLILIQRSGSRKFVKKDKMAAVIEKAATDFGLKYYLFVDNPVPSMEQSMQAFNKALMIVAPHGAGLANMVYSKPGTFIIEGVCNPPHINMCYQRTAHLLGHHYHGIQSTSGCEGSINIEPSLFDSVVRKYFTEIKQRGFHHVFGEPVPLN